jgi:8-oxo-dGTP pyrophosphatase MutT (NUDIX family)
VPDFILSLEDATTIDVHQYGNGNRGIPRPGHAAFVMNKRDVLTTSSARLVIKAYAIPEAHLQLGIYKREIHALRAWDHAPESHREPPFFVRWNTSGFCVKLGHKMHLPFIKPLINQFFVPAPTEHQVGVIPYARVGAQITYLLITSRGTGKWIFPKGALEPGTDPRELAAREAREEAGVAGRVAPEPLGTYQDWKSLHGRKVAIEVALYPMLVEEQFSAWEEAKQRYRHWVTFPELRALLTNRAILELATRLNTTLR